MKYTFLIPATFLLLILSAFTTVDTQPITIFTIGDSTMADYNTQNGYQGRGWAQMLPCFLTEANVKIENHASSGRSTFSFINEGRWDKVLSRLKKGDYVFIQFGHNDEKTTKELHTVPGGSLMKIYENSFGKPVPKGLILYYLILLYVETTRHQVMWASARTAMKQREIYWLIHMVNTLLHHAGLRKK